MILLFINIKIYCIPVHLYGIPCKHVSVVVCGGLNNKTTVLWSDDLNIRTADDDPLNLRMQTRATIF